VDERFRRVIESLCNLGGEVLLVIDNLDNAQDKDLGDIFRLPGKVLANSRLKLEKFDHYDLDFLEPAACHELFYRFYKREKDDLNLHRVLELAGYHTLTVELLARMAHRALQSLADLRCTLEKKGFNLNEVIQRDVTTLWDDGEKKRRFFDHILKVFPISGLEEEEKYILMNLSLLPSVFIEIKKLCIWLGLADNKGINSLVEKGWLKESGWKIFLHQVMAEAIYYQSKPDVRKAKHLITALEESLSCKPGENRLERQYLLHFVESVVIRLKNEKDKALAGLINNLALLCKALGQLRLALDYQLKAIEIYREVLSPDHPELAAAFNNVAEIYKNLGDFNRMIEYMQKAFEIYEDILPADHPELALSYSNLSLCYEELNDFQLALKWQLKANKIAEKIFHDTHPDLAKSYNNLSFIYQSLNELEKALEFQLKSIDIKKRLYQKKAHSDLALSYNNLSTIYVDMNKLDHALNFQLKAIAITKKVLPEEHPITAAAFNNLSKVYLAMGNWERALKFQLKSIEIKEKVHPEDHYSFANSYQILSKIFNGLNRRGEASDYARRAVTILEKCFPKGHPKLDKSRQNLECIIRNEPPQV